MMRRQSLVAYFARFTKNNNSDSTLLSTADYIVCIVGSIDDADYDAFN